MNSFVSAIVLAAGTSSRMGGDNKLLLPFRNSTVIRNTVEQVLCSGVKEVLIVTGFQNQLVTDALSGLPVSVVFNPLFGSGMTSSIQSGVRAATGNAYMICLGDLPAVQAREYQELVSRASELDAHPDPYIILPRYRQSRANPVIFSKAFRDVILAHQEPEGCKSIVAASAANLHWVEMELDHVIKDIDTKSDYLNLMHDN